MIDLYQIIAKLRMGSCFALISGYPRICLAILHRNKLDCREDASWLTCPTMHLSLQEA